MFIGTLVLAFFLLVMLGNAAEIWDALGEMDVAYLPLLLVISLLGFPAGAISLMGAVNVRLKLWATTEMMLAQSFLNRFTPANAGGNAAKLVEYNYTVEYDRQFALTAAKQTTEQQQQEFEQLLRQRQIR